MELDLDAVSGICGSISIVCWVVVFSPQIIESFRRQSTDGLSVAFLVIWLVGDAFNILGAIMQGVLPTMIILAVYYTLADLVLLGQVWWYRGSKLTNKAAQPVTDYTFNNSVDDLDEESHLVSSGMNGDLYGGVEGHGRRGSFSSIQRYLSIADGTHLSPATPLLSEPKAYDALVVENIKPQTVLRKVVFNVFAVFLVCAAGIFGWWLSEQSSSHKHHNHAEKDLRGGIPQFDPLGQFFGYLCTIFYLGSRVPQLLLNYRRKSTEGISLLFFLFACIGNITYDMSIIAFNPAPRCEHGPKHCMAGEEKMIYLRYIAVNTPWIAGSLGTLLLDMTIFVQFFLYWKGN